MIVRASRFVFCGLILLLLSYVGESQETATPSEGWTVPWGFPEKEYPNLREITPQQQAKRERSSSSKIALGNDMFVFGPTIDWFWRKPWDNEQSPNVAKLTHGGETFNWVDPSYGGEVYGIYDYVRTRDKDIEQLIGGYIAFRPIVIDFQWSSLAIGGFLVQSLTTLQFGDRSEQGIDKDTGKEAQIDVDGAQILVEDTAIGLSLFWSCPDSLFQILVECGYVFRDLDLKIKAVDITGPAIDPLKRLRYHDYRLHQEENSIAFNFEVRKFFVDENGPQTWFSFVILSVIADLPIGDPSRKSTAAFSLPEFPTFDRSERIELPGTVFGGGLPVPDIQDTAIRTGLINATLLVQLLRLPVLGPHAITFDALGGISHIAEDNGHSLGLGGQITLFDAVGAGFTYVWQQQNEQPDAITITVQFGLY